MEVQEDRFYTGKNEYLSIVFLRWQKFHVANMLFALLLSLLGCYTFVSFEMKFSPYCPLKAKIGITGEQIDLNNTKWGEPAVCHYVFYVSVVQIILALFGLILFCSQPGQSNLEGGFRGNPQLRLLPPTCICCLIIAVISFLAAMLLTFGGSDLYKSIEAQLQSSDISLQHWQKDEELHNYEFHLTSSQISYWLTTHAFLTHGLITLLRWETNADYVITEERELRENPNFQDIILQALEEDEDTLKSVSLLSKLK